MNTRHLPATRRVLAGVLALGVLLAGCGPQSPPPPAATATTEPAPVPVADDAAGDAAATEPAETALTPEALEALLAPIALYPDPVLAQVLAAATNPQMVLDAGNWLIANPGLEGRALDEAAEPLGFSPSMRALLQFPEVVDMMCMKLDWTTQLGEAFAADQAGVLDAVQRLRKQSADVGNLVSSDQLKVETSVEEGKEIITVEPADPKVVYVPKYDPVAVYAPPPATIPAPATTTVIEEKQGHSTGALITTGLLSFGAGLLVAEVFDDDDDWDDYYPNYGYGGMYYGGRPYYPPPPGYYRPPYGGSYRPGYGYNRPPNYQNGFNDNTIIINNQGNDYWISFDRKPGSAATRPASPITTARGDRPDRQRLEEQQRTRQAEASARPRPAATGKEAGWQGQQSYAGAKGKAEQAVRSPSGDRAAAPAKVQGSYAGARPEGKAARDAMVAGRPDASAGGVPRPAAKPADRGYGDGSRQAGSSRPATASRPDKQKQASRPDPRPASQQAPQRQPDRQARPAKSDQGGASFGGASRGSSDRAASQRGRQSMPQGARSKGSGASKGGGAGKSRR